MILEETQDTQRNFQLYFANEVCNIILSKVFELQNFLTEWGGVMSTQEVLEKAIFYKYQTNITNSMKVTTQQVASLAVPCYSILDILQMT